MLEEAVNKVREQLQEVDKLLQDPQVISNIKELNKLSQKRATLVKIVELADALEQIEKDIKDYHEMLKEESDSELEESIRAEIDQLEKEKEKLTFELKMALIPPDPNDNKNAIIEIRAGTGGDEAAIFAGDLYRMYVRFAEKNNFKVEVMSSTPSEMGGFKEITFMVSGGDKPYGTLKYESGVHRVQRIPATESQGRVHTSAASVVVMPEAEDIDIEINENDLRIDTYRASGAGGQHVNKTDSAVRITHIPTGVVVACQEERSQIQNRAKAMKLLKTKLYELELQKKEKEEAQKRKSIIRSGDRSEKIRTYNFPQNRVTDHRINLTLYNLEAVMDGELNEIIEALKTADYEEFLKKL